MSTEAGTPDWIYPGADVVVYADNHRRNGAAMTYYVTKVGTVAKQSFTVEHERVDVRIKLDGLQSKSFGGNWHSWCWRVVEVGSEKHHQLREAYERQRVKSAAIAAVAAWGTGSGRDGVAETDAAIEALTAWRNVLATGEAP